MKKNQLQLVLASSSPRRKQILKDSGFEFLVMTPNSSESFSENLTLEENLTRVVMDKAWAAFSKLSSRNNDGFIVLSADTVVCLGKLVLGKPRNARDAKAMLGRLRNKTHCVKTAICLLNSSTEESVIHIESTLVKFHRLTDAEIQKYIDSGEPFDKAGSYGIQGLGASFIKSVDGDFLNVVGLPLRQVQRLLEKKGWNVRTSRSNRRHSRSHRSS
ncbi:MAG: septum formation protein Maf [Oligoflexia bacterium]|nr:septum formation protein Maf [Oligoflexia bacterium]